MSDERPQHGVCAVVRQWESISDALDISSDGVLRWTLSRGTFVALPGYPQPGSMYVECMGMQNISGASESDADEVLATARKFHNDAEIAAAAWQIAAEEFADDSEPHGSLIHAHGIARW